MTLFSKLYDSIRPVVQTEEQARKIADVLSGAIEDRSQNYVTREYLDLKIDHLEQKLEQKMNSRFAAVDLRISDLELRLVQKYNLNTLIVSAVTVASVVITFLLKK